MPCKHSYIKGLLPALALAALAIASCKKDGNPNKLPSVSTGDYAGLIDGYKSSDDIFPQNLVAYWAFDDTKEAKTGFTPAQAAGNSLVDGGVRGKALSLSAGYLYYAAQFPKFKTDSLKSFSISLWVKILNNGSKRTMVFQLARPGIFNGDINFALNTNSYPATDLNNLKIQPLFTTVGGGTQDNLNAQNGTFPYLTPKIGMDKWTHLLITYDGTSGVFNVWADGVKVGAYPNRGTGNNLFKAWEPSELIIGSNYNGIPGKSVSTDVSFAPMTGQVDEIRVYNISLPDAHIKALFNLGKAGK